MSDIRRIEVLKEGNWAEINFSDIKKGDVVRMFEPTGDPVLVENKYAEWRVTSDGAYSRDEDGLMTIDCEAIVYRGDAGFCTSAPSAEYHRASDEDAPCDDSRDGE